MSSNFLSKVGPAHHWETCTGKTTAKHLKVVRATMHQLDARLNRFAGRNHINITTCSKFVCVSFRFYNTEYKTA